MATRAAGFAQIYSSSVQEAHDLALQCGNCSFVCPHSVIRPKFYHESALAEAPVSFRSAPIDARGLPETHDTLQVFLEDCTGCGLCVEVCRRRARSERG